MHSDLVTQAGKDLYEFLKHYAFLEEEPDLTIRK